MFITSNLEEHAYRAILLLTDLEGWLVAWAGPVNLVLMLGTCLAVASFAYRNLVQFISPSHAKASA